MAVEETANLQDFPEWDQENESGFKYWQRTQVWLAKFKKGLQEMPDPEGTDEFGRGYNFAVKQILGAE